MAEILDALAAGKSLPNAVNPSGRRIFRLPEHNAEFVRSGYFCEQLLPPQVAAQMLDEVLNLKPDDSYDPNGRLGDQVSYHMTELDTNHAYKLKVRALAERYFAEPVERLLVDYRVLTTTLFVKPPGKGKIPIHTDWTVQEDLSWPTIYIWCALEDVEEANGPLYIYPGSHGIIDFLHGPRMTSPYCTGDADLERQSTAIPVKAGEAVMFDAGALHWSPDNLSERPRFAVRMACIPKHRRGVLFRECPDDAGTIEMFSMETEEFHNHSGPELIAGAFKTQMLRKLVNPDERLSNAEIEALVKTGDTIRSGETSMQAVLADFRRLNTPEALVPVAQATVTSPYRRARLLAGRLYRRTRSLGGIVLRQVRKKVPIASLAPPSPSTPRIDEPDFAPYPASDVPWKPFTDAAVNAALRERGYATFGFMAPADVDNLAAVVEAVETELDRGDVHIPTHFMLSAFNNDGAYKERLFDAVWQTLEQRVAAILPDYEPLVINVFDKPPGDAYDPVPIHQNPSFVDEPAHRSVSLWIPFCDVDRSNGTVGVLPRSHGRFNTMRAGNMAHEEVFADVQTRLEDDLFVPVEMPKGHMLALDDSILHWSYPNVSATRRKAVQLIMVPRGVPHIYYYYDDADAAAPMMDLYTVDRNFFFGFNCKARPETLPKIGRVPFRYRRIAESELPGGNAAQ